MATPLTPKRIDLSQINGGNRLEVGDNTTTDTFNAPIEASAYAQQLAESVSIASAIAKGTVLYNQVNQALATAQIGVTVASQTDVDSRTLKSETINSNNIKYNQTITSLGTIDAVFIGCYISVSSLSSTSAEYTFIGCSGSLNVSTYTTSSSGRCIINACPELAISGISIYEWDKVYFDGFATYEQYVNNTCSGNGAYTSIQNLEHQTDDRIDVLFQSNGDWTSSFVAPSISSGVVIPFGYSGSTFTRLEVLKDGRVRNFATGSINFRYFKISRRLK